MQPQSFPDTRRRLDELDSLLRRMMEVPTADTTYAPATIPIPIRLDPYRPEMMPSTAVLEAPPVILPYPTPPVQREYRPEPPYAEAFREPRRDYGTWLISALFTLTGVGFILASLAWIAAERLGVDWQAWVGFVG